MSSESITLSRSNGVLLWVVKINDILSVHQVPRARYGKDFCFELSLKDGKVVVAAPTATVERGWKAAFTSAGINLEAVTLELAESGQRKSQASQQSGENDDLSGCCGLRRKFRSRLAVFKKNLSRSEKQSIAERFGDLGVSYILIMICSIGWATFMMISNPYSVVRIYNLVLACIIGPLTISAIDCCSAKRKDAEGVGYCLITLVTGIPILLRNAIRSVVYCLTMGTCCGCYLADNTVPGAKRNGYQLRIFCLIFISDVIFLVVVASSKGDEIAGDLVGFPQLVFTLIVDIYYLYDTFRCRQIMFE